MISTENIPRSEKTKRIYVPSEYSAALEYILTENNEIYTKQRPPLKRTTSEETAERKKWAQTFETAMSLDYISPNTMPSFETNLEPQALFTAFTNALKNDKEIKSRINQKISFPYTPSKTILE